MSSVERKEALMECIGEVGGYGAVAIVIVTPEGELLGCRETIDEPGLMQAALDACYKALLRQADQKDFGGHKCQWCGTDIGFRRKCYKSECMERVSGGEKPQIKFSPEVEKHMDGVVERVNRELRGGG